MKFKKTFELRVQYPYDADKNGDPLPGDTNHLKYSIVRFPSTVEFTIERHEYADANSANFKIFNLSRETRELMFKERWRSKPVRRRVEFYAGYEDEANLSLCFNGYLTYGRSTRRGPDIITELDCLDPMISVYDNLVSMAMQKTIQMSKYDVLKALFVALGYDKNGVISETFKIIPFIIPDSSPRGKVLEVQTIEAIRNVIGQDGRFYFDNDTAIALAGDEVTGDSVIQTIDTDTGLINVPTISEQAIFVPLLFSPQFQVGQKVNIAAAETSTYSDYNDVYRICGIRHAGMISATHDANTTTTLALQIKNKEVAQ